MTRGTEKSGRGKRMITSFQTIEEGETWAGYRPTDDENEKRNAKTSS